MSVLRSLEWLFRHLIAYPFLRIVFRNPVHEGLIDLQKVERLLILRYDRIGDMIVTTPIIRKLKSVNPRLKIGVFTSPLNAEIIASSLSVDDIYILEKNWWKLAREIIRARRMKYDVVLNFIFNRTTSGALLAGICAPKGVKVGQGAEKYRSHFNKLVKLQRSSAHMVEILALFVRDVFGVTFQDEDLHFEISIDEDARQAVDRSLQQHGLHRRSASLQGALPYVVFNLSATDPATRISMEQARELADRFGRIAAWRTILIVAPNDHEMQKVAREASDAKSCLAFPNRGRATLREIASLVEGAICVVTPDTSLIHFASAMRTPVIGFFTTVQSLQEWFPWKVENRVVTVRTGRPVSSLSVEEMWKNICKFINEIESKQEKKESSATP